MMHGPSGFASSNVTKGLLLTTFIFSLVAQATKKTHLFNLDLGLVGDGEVWRLLTHNFVWSSSSELVLGSILLYTWRLFERQFGSRKFGGCAFFLLLGSTILQVCVLAFSRGVIKSGGKDWLFSSGPYGLAFGLLTMFFLDIPQSAPFKVFGIPLSDKLFVYILALQLGLSSIPGSSYTAIIGIVLGLLYHLEFLPFHRLRVPQWLSDGCSRAFDPILSGSLFSIMAGVQDRQGRRLGGSGRVGGPLRVPGQGAAHAPGVPGAGGYAPVQEGEVLNDMGYGHMAPAAAASAPVIADPAAVQQLVGMGFAQDRAIAALQATRNDVPAATNRLLGL